MQFSIAKAISCTCTTGLHGVPSEWTSIRFFSRPVNNKLLKTMSDRAKSAVDDGVMSASASVTLADPEASKLIEQSRVKVIPFLDSDEAGPISAAVAALEIADSATLSAKKEELKRLLVPHSYLF